MNENQIKNHQIMIDSIPDAKNLYKFESDFQKLLENRMKSDVETDRVYFKELAHMEQKIDRIKKKNGSSTYLNELYPVRDLLHKIAQTKQNILEKIVHCVIIDVGAKYPRILLSELGEIIKIGSESELKVIIKAMINKEYIHAEFFETSDAIVFDQSKNKRDIDIFLKKLDDNFQNWNQSENLKLKKSTHS